jgi:cytochrome c oxidase assembly factor CtaG
MAHGVTPADPSMWWLQWAFEPLIWSALLVAAFLYFRAARRVRGWPSVRTLSFVAGVMAAFVALSGPPAVFDTALFWVHMVQHVLLVLIAAPLIVLGAPATLSIRAAADPYRGQLRRFIHSPVVRFAAHPGVAWLSFVLVLVVSHFSGLYNTALENEFVHVLEHSLYLGTALMFWTPVVGLDPSTHRLGWPVRVVYVLLTMPVQAFVGLALYSSDRPLYDHYATVERSWGPSPLNDQQMAAVIMWIGGEFLTLIALVGVVLAWMRYDDRLAAREDRRLAQTL